MRPERCEINMRKLYLHTYKGITWRPPVNQCSSTAREANGAVYQASPEGRDVNVRSVSWRELTKSESYSGATSELISLHLTGMSTGFHLYSFQFLCTGLTWVYFWHLSLDLTIYIFTLIPFFGLRLSHCKPHCDNLSAYSVPLDCSPWSRLGDIVCCLFGCIFIATSEC